MASILTNTPRGPDDPRHGDPRYDADWDRVNKVTGKVNRDEPAPRPASCFTSIAKALREYSTRVDDIAHLAYELQQDIFMGADLPKNDTVKTAGPANVMSELDYLGNSLTYLESVMSRFR